MARFALYLLVAVLSHYLASFVQVALHYCLGHRRVGGRFHRTHVGEHHTIYSGKALVAARYHDEEDASRYYLVPAALIGLTTFALMPTDLALVHVGAVALSFAAHVHLHGQYHLKDPWLGRFRWFRRKQRLHLAHHRDMTKNFGVIEFVWDRRFGTYEPLRRATSASRAAIWVVTLTVALNACATVPRVEPPPGPGGKERLARDQAECREAAARAVDSTALQEIIVTKVGGLLAGALAGLFIVAAADSGSGSVNAEGAGIVVGAGAAIGLLVGATVGLGRGIDRALGEARECSEAWTRCLRERGYTPR